MATSTTTPAKTTAKKTAAKKTTGTRRTTSQVSTESSGPTIQLPEIEVVTMLVPIKSMSPLIVHNFSAKSKRMMLEAQQGIKNPKQHRNPEEEYEASFYRMGDDETSTTYGFPVVAFKAATIGAARFFNKSVKMTEVRQFLFFRGVMTPAHDQELVQLHHPNPPEMREDVVRLGGMNRSADLRYRPMFREWSTTLEVSYVKTALSQTSVLSLIDGGGMGVGVGEWRPEKNGTNGRYQIDTDKGVTILG